MENVNIQNLINSVGEKISVNPEDIIGEKRSVKDGIILGRFLVYSILRDVYKMPLIQIAQAVNRKRHNTVIYALRRLKMDVDYDKFIELRNEIVQTLNK